jgi:hypothetical protein
MDSGSIPDRSTEDGVADIEAGDCDPPFLPGGRMADDKDDKNLLMRLGKWASALAGIGGVIAAVVTGIIQVDSLIDEVHQTRSTLTDLRSSMDSTSSDLRRQVALQEEIINNLRVAVAALQAIDAVRSGMQPVLSDPASARPRHRSGAPVGTLVDSLPPLPPSAPSGASPEDSLTHARQTAAVALDRADMLHSEM